MATAELDTLSEESYKDSTLIMQLLRDNLVSSRLTMVWMCLANLFTRRLSGPRRRPSRQPSNLPPLRRPIRLSLQQRLQLRLQRSPRLPSKSCPSLDLVIFRGTVDTGVLGVLLETSLSEILHAFFATANTNKTMTFGEWGYFSLPKGRRAKE